MDDVLYIGNLDLYTVPNILSACNHEGNTVIMFSARFCILNELLLINITLYIIL